MQTMIETQTISPDSYWNRTAADALPSHPRLEGDLETEIAVVGAGITGLTAALHLKRQGRTVTLVEAGRIGTGTSGGTSAHLTAVHDVGLTELINSFGEKKARLIVEGLSGALDQIETWCRELAPDAEFARVPAYFYTEEDKNLAALEKEGDAARRLGLAAAMVESVPLPFRAAGGVRIENQGRFHSLKYLRRLAEAFQGDGCEIYDNTRVQPPESGTPCRLKTATGEIRAESVIMATHSPYLGVSELDFRVAPYQSYCIAARVEDALPDALFWDDAEPYHYTRLARGDDPHLLIIGGGDHKTGQGADERDRFAQLEAYARTHFRVVAIEHRWSAELFEPSDGAPLIGRMPLRKNIYVATGFSGVGLTFGTLAGTLIADLILQRERPLAEVLSPARVKAVAAAPHLVAENLNVAKRFVADRFTGERIASVEDVPRGTGRLVRLGTQQLAVYRDEQGAVHAMSPLCTHAGCIVQWNEAEKTWDCPCHGGRYTATGERLYGPPPHDLKRAGLGA